MLTVLFGKETIAGGSIITGNQNTTPLQVPRMNILIFNCGSSSQGFKLYQTGSKVPEVIASGKARNVATQTRADSVIEWIINGEKGALRVDLPSHREAARQIISLLKQHNLRVDAVGHRFVHGGTRFQHTTRVDASVMAGLKDCFCLAPIHNPNSFSVIEICAAELPAAVQYAVFDTAFHAGMPAEAFTYAIPADLASEQGYRKHGFHGLSYQYISEKTAEYLGKPLADLKLILCHLGTGGSSVTAMSRGCSIDSSMGYSPLPGLVMSTRSGDIDAEIVLDLIRNGMSVDEVETLLNNRSGLIGLSGFSSNLEEVIAQAEKGNKACQLAFDVYAHRLRHYLGAFHWLLNGSDAIVFTDDVGLRSWRLREKVCACAANLGVELDSEANRLTRQDGISCISTACSRTKILVMPTDEELVILNEVLGQTGH
jgi:acetate kinase